MIVIDASAMIEALVGRDADAELLEGLAGEIAAPHLLDIEVLSVLRGLTLGRRIHRPVVDQARTDYFAFAIARYDAQPLSERIWQLRRQYTAYDASYLALAEALGAALYTCDAKLTAGGHSVTVQVFPRS